MLELVCRNWRFSDILPQRVRYLITTVVNTKKAVTQVLNPLHDILSLWEAFLVLAFCGAYKWQHLYSASKDPVIQMCTS